MNKIYVGNLSYDLENTGIKSLFSIFGEIIKIKTILNKQNNRSKGYIFILFKDKNSSDSALNMNGKLINGRHIYVSKSSLNTGKSNI